jgi:molecular chaperone HtpG
LDQDGKTSASKLSAFIFDLLGEENTEVEAKSLASEELPAFILLDEQMRRMRDYMRMSQMGGMNFMGASKVKFIVNTNNKLIQSLEKLNRKDSELAKEIVKELYDLAKLNQRELEGKEMNLFGVHTAKLLEKLICRVID